MIETTRRAKFAVAGCIVLPAVLCGCPQKKNDRPQQQTEANATRAVERPRPAPPARDIEPKELSGRTVLLVTHPTLRVLRSFHLMVRERIIDVPGLYFVGVYHADEKETYRKSRAYPRKHNLTWMGFKKLTCKLDASRLFQKNNCTSPFKDLLRNATGIVFTGGADIPPALYGEKTDLATVVKTPKRHYWETSLLFHLLGSSRNPKFEPLMARRSTFPVLAICLGLQTMNVATGGTLVQDIPSELYGVKTFEAILKQPADRVHRNPHYYMRRSPDVWYGVFHPIRFTGAQKMWQKMFGSAAGGKLGEVSVMSIHHQAVDKVGLNLEVIATSRDGKVVEAMRHKRFPNVLAIQFHPEYNVIWDRSITARLHEKHPASNFFAAALAKDKRATAFHRGFWRVFSQRLRTQRSGQNKKNK